MHLRAPIRQPEVPENIRLAYRAISASAELLVTYHSSRAASVYFRWDDGCNVNTVIRIYMHYRSRIIVIAVMRHAKIVVGLKLLVKSEYDYSTRKLLAWRSGSVVRRMNEVTLR